MRKSILFRVLALVLAITLLAALAGCGGTPTGTPPPTTPSTPSAPTDPTNPTEPSVPSLSVQQRCEQAWQTYSTSQSSISDGSVIYCEGEYYTAIGNKLYPAETIAAYDYTGAGDPINIAVAQFRGIPYVAEPNNGPEAARSSNRYLTATVDGQTRYVSFYIDSDDKFITVYSKDGVEISQGTMGQIFALEPVETERVIKNIIFMVADGGGYDNFTLADKVKQEMVKRGVNKLAGAKTTVTTNLLSSLGISESKGLYLNQFLVGSANTLLWNPAGDSNNPNSYITDSAAAGTALSSGYKTRYCFMGIDPDGNPRASITELARLNGMSTGVVTNKSYVDATPLAFLTSHAIHRYEYQDNSMQALLSGVDVLIAEGTEFGDLWKPKPPLTCNTIFYFGIFYIYYQIFECDVHICFGNLEQIFFRAINRELVAFVLTICTVNGYFSSFRQSRAICGNSYICKQLNSVATLGSSACRKEICVLCTGGGVFAHVAVSRAHDHCHDKQCQDRCH